MKRNHKIILIGIICFAYILRVYGITWDHGYNLHPDERAILMYTLDLQFPHTFSEFLSPSSPLNPQFFAYGNFPLYLLKLLSVAASVFDTSLAQYERIALVGRVISAVADIGTLIVLFFISRKLFNTMIGLFAAMIYAVAVFPIQASHFYAVDILLTFFCLLTLYAILLLSERMEKKLAVITGVSFGLAMATKISAVVLCVPLLVFVFIAVIPLAKKGKSAHSYRAIKNLAASLGIIGLSAFIVFIVTQPYALIDWKSFLDQTRQQSMMTRDVFTFPYTMQYYGKIPYVYELKNVFLWGLGPVISALAVIGIIFYIKEPKKRLHSSLIFGSFFAIYFLIIGNFAVGWMRYMLPLYPLFALGAGVAVYKIIHLLEKVKIQYIIVCSLLAIGIAYWPMSFIQIYGKQHPRVAASDWILLNIPPGSSIATEHWDDRLPLYESEKYLFNELALYESDSPEKWTTINTQLANSEYIILASNRLYTPLQKLTNCEVLPTGKCYPETAKYYQDLFSGKRRFIKVAEFTNYPTVPIFNIPIDDQSSDESFTVYDHPKVIIFKQLKN